MKTLSIDVRRAEPTDARAISEVHREAWRQAYAGLIPHKALTQMLERRGEAWWRRATRGPATLLVLDVAGTIAGYATIGLNRARALPQDGEIYEIYLRRSFRASAWSPPVRGNAQTFEIAGLQWPRSLVPGRQRTCDRFFRRHGGLDLAEGMEDFDGVNLRKIGFVWPETTFKPVFSALQPVG